MHKQLHYKGTIRGMIIRSDWSLAAFRRAVLAKLADPRHDLRMKFADGGSDEKVRGAVCYSHIPNSSGSRSICRTNQTGSMPSHKKVLRGR